MGEQIHVNLKVSPEMRRLLAEARERDVSEEDLREQRISFAYGNALNCPLITKDSVRRADDRIRLCPVNDD